MSIHDLIDRLGKQEETFRHDRFIAPCVGGGKLRVRIAGLVHELVPEPQGFEGWGLFEAAADDTAQLVEEAGLAEVERYLRLLKPLRLRLAAAISGRTWLAYPVSESDARQRLGQARPMPVHLVEGGASFEVVVVGWDGAAAWFEDIDRRADPEPADQLREQIERTVMPADLRFSGLTREMRTAYELATQTHPGFAQLRRARLAAEHRRQARQQDEARLQQALERSGGRIRSFRDQSSYWVVEWTTADGARHTSAIAKDDLTVLSAGLCLDGHDRDFDLQSLVGVVENADRWAVD
jgi:hypothetical protein